MVLSISHTNNSIYYYLFEHKRAAVGIGLSVNAHKTEYVCPIKQVTFPH